MRGDALILETVVDEGELTMQVKEKAKKLILAFAGAILACFGTLW